MVQIWALLPTKLCCPPSWIFKSWEFYLLSRFGRPMCVITPSFAPISQTFRRYNHFSIFQDGDRPPSWICVTRVWTTHEEYLVVFITVQNMVVIGAVISIVCTMHVLIFCVLSLKIPIRAHKIRGS